MEIYIEDGKGGVRLYDRAAEGSDYYVMCTPRNKAVQVRSSWTTTLSRQLCRCIIKMLCDVVKSHEN